MTDVRWTFEAFEDLKSIRDTIQRDSAAYAQLVTSRLYEAVGVLSEHPDLGRVVPERHDPNVRELVRAPYRIVYRRRAEAVEILTIFHGARQFPDRLPGGIG
ncbi:MAG: type II toxin-antitoxin system RelE/ParE family toxin [Gemmatimonadaceae bacterium]|nr:type II toxin-antitoxin system RelE/ParE family toxin [Gemmatimonadaceae bacterium]